MDFFFDGHWRLDFGLGNPNKTAVLIACLLVLSLCLARSPADRPAKRKRSLGTVRFAIFLLVFAGLGGCLIHTYSRGGMLAAIAGLLIAWFSATLGKNRSRPRVGAFAAVCLGLVCYANLDTVNAADRYLLGAGEDRSIGNRLVLWSAAPRMMADAPGGWGFGRSGDSWAQWYQSDDTRYEYRTMVNSHLTWLVELGWVGRFFYLCAWGFVLRLCWPAKRDRHSPGAGIALGVWVAFGVGAVFSSVAEAPVLWVLPLAGLAMTVLGKNPQEEQDPPPSIRWRRDGVAIATLALLTLVAVACFGRTPSDTTQVRARSGDVQLSSPASSANEAQPADSRLRIALVAPDPRILGGHFGRTIRNHIELSPANRQSWLISEKGNLSEPSLDAIVLSGVGPAKISDRWSARSWHVFNPAPDLVRRLLNSPAAHNGDVRIYLGGERRDQDALEIRRMLAGNENITLVQVAGFLHFIRTWTMLVQSSSQSTPPSQP